jgi:hypothetical protein
MHDQRLFNGQPGGAKGPCRYLVGHAEALLVLISFGKNGARILVRGDSHRVALALDRGIDLSEQHGTFRRGTRRGNQVSVIAASVDAAGSAHGKSA